MVSYQNHRANVVEVGGIEPPSESTLIQFSPSASTILGFPSPHASQQAYDYGSFMLRATPQSFGVLVPHIADAGILTCGQ